MPSIKYKQSLVPMLDRFKDAINKVRDNDNTTTESTKKPPSIEVHLLSPKQIDEYRQQIKQIAVNLQQIEDICVNNKQDVMAFIEQQRQEKKEAEEEGEGKKGEEGEVYTLPEDLEEIKQLLQDVQVRINKVEQSNEEVKARAKGMPGEGNDKLMQQLKEAHDLNRRYETDLKALKASEENSKEILITLRHQTELYTNETKSLQQKCQKLQRQLQEKSSILTNLQQQKKVLLQLRAAESNSVNPEVQKLRGMVQQAEKKVTIEKTKVQQKEKEVDSLKKKLEEERDSLEKIADELKEKELKSKKVIDKYERSKTEIRKYREEKTQFIKKLNVQIANLSDKAYNLGKENEGLKAKVEELTKKIDELEGGLARSEGKALELDSLKEEVRQLRQEGMEYVQKLEESEEERKRLQDQSEGLQLKRKSLLQALEKPVNHQIRTLDKIIRALQKLYKDYISIVFEQGNIIGFEARIQYILSNVCEIKQDLKL